MRPRLRSWSSSPVLSALFRWALGGVFLYAGCAKALDPVSFAQAIDNYRLLPGWMVNPTAILLPWIEILAGLGLLLGAWIPGGALIASGLLVAFSGALGISLLRGLDIECGCFGASAGANRISSQDLVRDLVLLGMGVHVLLLDRQVASPARWFSRLSWGRKRPSDPRRGVYNL